MILLNGLTDGGQQWTNAKNAIAAMTATVLVRGLLPFKFQNIKRIDIVRKYSGKKYTPKRSFYQRYFSPWLSFGWDSLKFVFTDFNLIAWAVKAFDGRPLDIFTDIGSGLAELSLDIVKTIPSSLLMNGFGLASQASMFALDKLGVFDLAYTEEPTYTFIEVHGIVLDYDNGYTHNNSPTFQCLRTRSFLNQDSERTTNASVAPFNSIPTPIGSACIYRNSSGKLILATSLTYKGPNKSRQVGYNVSPGFEQEDVDKTNEFLRSMLGSGDNKTVDDFLDGCDAMLGDTITYENLEAIPATVEKYTDDHLTTVSEMPEVGSFKLSSNRSRVASNTTTTDINTLIRY